MGHNIEIVAEIEEGAVYYGEYIINVDDDGYEDGNLDLSTLTWVRSVEDPTADADASYEVICRYLQGHREDVLEALDETIRYREEWARDESAEVQW